MSNIYIIGLLQTKIFQINWTWFNCKNTLLRGNRLETRLFEKHSFYDRNSPKEQIVFETVW